MKHQSPPPCKEKLSKSLVNKSIIRVELTRKIEKYEDRRKAFKDVNCR